MNIVLISLQKTKVIKVNFSFSKLNILLLTIFEILSTIMIIAMSLMCKELSYIEFVSETTKIEVVAKIVFAGWSLMVVGLIAWLIAWFSEEAKSKD